MSALVSGATLDHVHLCVTDRPRAIAWYARVFDLHVLGQDHGEVADDHPIFLAPASKPNASCLSLFVGEPARGGDRNVAFVVGAEAFVEFAAALPNDDIHSKDGGVLTADQVYDYVMVLAFTFIDPDGNHLEVVTYEADAARAGLRG